MKDIERFRYRVEDIARGVTKKAVRTYRAREPQLKIAPRHKLRRLRLKANFKVETVTECDNVMALEPPP